MSEELLKAIIKLFAIVAKERITDQERENIREFLAVHLNQESTQYYLTLFEQYVREYKVEQKEELNVDDETLEFVDEWSNIIKISREVNKALTIRQKMVLVIKIIELIYADGSISERQGNLMFYIGESLKIPNNDINQLRAFVVGEDYEELSNKNILIIDDGSGSYEVKGPRVTAKGITGLIAVLRIPDTETYFIKYLGISVLYLNGISLKSRQIDVFPTGSTIRGNKIETIYYSDIINRFLTSQEKIRITFTAEHLFYHFKSGRAGLQNVNVSAEGGNLIGIMGASGSGKSTLLSVLNGTEKPSSGRVIINGIDIHKTPEEAEGLIGYVPQDDFLIGELTVFDNLFYAAKLCFGNNSPEQNKELVSTILRNLGLSEIANLKVGSPMDKTISGGQRKRLNIGLELLREPSILYVDEPTSGLSSRDSENIMDLLKELSFRGKMVFVVIHQPSSDIFKMFDSLLILDVGGLPIYFGNPVESVTYFKEIINAANKAQSSCPECGNINPEQVFNIIETRVVNEFGRFTDIRKVSPDQWYQYFREYIKVPRIKHIKEKLKVIQKIPGRFSQFKTFLRRDLKTKLANRQYLLINLLEAPILALFMGLMVRYYTSIEVDNPEYVFKDNSNIPIYFFMSVIVALFMGLTVSAEEIFRDRMLLKRESFLNLSKSSYLLSKLGVLFLISAIQTASFALIGDLILDIRGMEPWFWLILFSTSCFANVLGLNISASFNSAVTIYILIPVLLIPQLLLSGVVVPFEKFNPKATNMETVPIIGDVMASRWAFEAAMVTQYRLNPIERDLYKVEVDRHEAEYINRYYIAKLSGVLSGLFNNIDHLNSGDTEKFNNDLTLVKQELQKEINYLNGTIPPWLPDLTLQQFNKSMYDSLIKKIRVLDAVYTRKYNEAVKKKDLLIISLLDFGYNYDSLQKIYHNDAVTEQVTQKFGDKQVIRIDNELVRKFYPIYNLRLEPNHFFDYRTQFYFPEKYFMGQRWPTLAFNLFVIWCMSLVLFVVLYFDGLKRIVNAFASDKRKRKQRRIKFN